MGKGYYVGLDMGTGSVGWAVTDESYQIFRRHGKAMWGVRLFESAKTAEERRMFRTGRRRLDRRGWRIEILQEIFAEEISRVDPGFFLRMKESKYYPEDKRDIQGNCPELPYTLFVDKTFTDKDFHKKYPTIYHLRKMLMETEDTPDMRLVYLALHHMMKHRGHFLLSGDISQVTEFKNTFNQFIENIRNEEMDFEIELDESAVQMIEETLKDKNLTRSAKKAKLVKGLNAKNVRDKAFLTLLSGGTVKLSDLFGMEELNEGERPKISFADNRYEEYAAVVEMELGELYYIVESAKAVYDWAILSDILGGSTSVSDAKVRAYEKHKADLKYLKAVVKEYNKAAGAYFMLVSSKDKKGKEQRTIEFVPIYLKDRVEKDMESARNYLMEERGLREPKILIKKIKIDTLFKVDGFYMWLSGRTSNQLIFKGANQLILSKEDMKTLKKVVKYIQRQKEDKNVKISVRDGITEEELLKLYETFLDKIRHSIYGVRLSSQEKTLVNGKEKFIDLSVEAKCQVLYEILHLFQCQSGASNLKMIGGPASAGILVMNNNISKCKNISIVNQSPTGIYEKEIDLLRV